MKLTQRILLGVLCSLVALPISATNREINVAVTPTVLVRKSSGTWVTVHAKVPIAEVNRDSACLIITAKDGSVTALDPVRLLPDDCGDLVAKFDRGVIQRILTVPQKTTFAFEVYRLDGSLFTGSASVTVK